MEKSVDSKALTYTSAPLDSDIEITGTPLIHLWVSSTSKDGYFFAFLEEVDGKTNVSHYITNGMIRAGCRALSDRFPWTDFGIPYHRCYKTDYQPLTPGQPEALDFSFYPTSYILRRGNRIRVSITGSLQTNYAGMVENPPPRLSIFRDSSRLSYLELPEIPAVKVTGI